MEGIILSLGNPMILAGLSVMKVLSNVLDQTYLDEEVHSQM